MYIIYNIIYDMIWYMHDIYIYINIHIPLSLYRPHPVDPRPAIPPLWCRTVALRQVACAARWRAGSAKPCTAQSIDGGTPKWMIWGYPYFGNPPYDMNGLSFFYALNSLSFWSFVNFELMVDSESRRFFYWIPSLGGWKQRPKCGKTAVWNSSRIYNWIHCKERLLNHWR